MASLAQVRSEFGEALAELEQRVYTNPPASPEFPCVIVGFPTAINFDETLAGHARYQIVLTVLVSMADVEAAETELDSILTGNLRGLINNHNSAVWRAMHVESVTNIRAETVGNATALAADINVTLIA